MNVCIQPSNIDLTDAIDRQTVQRVASALGDYLDCIREAVVYMKAASELAKNLSLACRIDLELRPYGRLTAQTTDENIDLAIHCAASRLVDHLDTAQNHMRPCAMRSATGS